ncbi:hypothetical protein STRDD10_00905 [Streptococcus sp. DD10]|uniref:DUF4651 domain-containing protein n=1 Tax=Streptococcus sp. DD10 TaxID=1777878 RepID=UPI0007966D59|nr:DUF4651 domain-containing protein [Streptococcus sp. DD10]KXT74446.1 hypothetical protein STRDD10_00905 [Streptococcus sp. DD10]
MKSKKIVASVLALAGLGVAAYAGKKIVEDKKRAQKQEEMVAEIRQLFLDMGVIATLYVELYKSDDSLLEGGVIFEDGRHYSFVYEDGILHYEEE